MAKKSRTLRYGLFLRFSCLALFGFRRVILLLSRSGHVIPSSCIYSYTSASFVYLGRGT